MGALDKLKSLGKPKVETTEEKVPEGLQDPAILGAKRNKTTVTLGSDPEFAPKAFEAARLQRHLKKAEDAFKVAQSELREYGAKKRELYNKTFRADITTVNIPYSFVTTEGTEEKHVQVICTNKYSVNGEMVLGNQEVLGDKFDQLFTVKTVKSLKPDAEDLFREVLMEQGMSAEEVDNAMEKLLEVKKDVSTKPDFETKILEMPENIQLLLGQGVSRVSPAIKFP